LDVELVFFDQIKEQIEGALEDFQADFVVSGFHAGF
jgi:hypothetical protein